MMSRSVVGWALAGALPAVVVATVLLLREGASTKLWLTLLVMVVGAWLFAVYALHERVSRSLQTLANLLEALRSGDFSVRARGARKGEALGEVHAEINALGDLLRDQRLGAHEATTLLRTVVDQIGVVVVAFDPEDKVRLINPSGARLLGGTVTSIMGKSAAELEVEDWLTARSPSILERAATRWEMQRSTFRQSGVPHRLVVLTEVQRVQREAWQRLVRVLGHEINNSLAPISSIAESLRAQADRPDRAPDWQDDLKAGLDVIARRSQALTRFMTAYAELAKLPPPRLAPVAVAEWIARVAALERRVPIDVRPGPETTLHGDGDQLDQLLINLVRNAGDVAKSEVVLAWTVAAGRLTVTVEDDGPGIVEGADLFVPFYTTKPNGSGIGLPLARQIAEAHGGGLTLENRDDAQGCQARLVLPL